MVRVLVREDRKGWEEAVQEEEVPRGKGAGG